MVEGPADQLTAVPQQLGRRVQGACALLLPFNVDGSLAFDAWETQLYRVLGTDLVPAVNMDTGHVQLLNKAMQQEILRRTAQGCAGRPFICGVTAPEGNLSLLNRYRSRVDAVTQAGGIPIIFPGPEMRAMDEAAVVALHADLAREVPELYAFELGEAFVPWGRIYSMATVARLMEIPNLTGMKHSSLDRRLEWARLQCRAQLRPDFKLMTGNDLAIDMVQWGSDYLLGLAAFHPEAFAQRDRWWADQDDRYFALNDALQALGAFTFREPVPAYRHSAAQYLYLRGIIEETGVPARQPSRPDGDLPILRTLLKRVQDTMAATPEVGP